MKSDNDLISASLDACKFTDRHISDDIGCFKYMGPWVDDGTAFSVGCNHGVFLSVLGNIRRLSAYIISHGVEEKQKEKNRGL
jgi:hypothetical protein